MYKVEFYTFLKQQPVDKIMKIHTFLEIRRFGLLHENIPSVFFKDIKHVDIGLRIISTYYKKSLCPGEYERQLFFDYLYSNTNYFLDNDVIKSLHMFMSQFFLYGHHDLKKTNENFGIYTEFISRMYEFCNWNLGTDYYEVGIQVLHLLLDILKGLLLDIIVIHNELLQFWLLLH